MAAEDGSGIWSRLVSARGPGGQGTDPQARNRADGPLVWLHAGSAGTFPAICQLAERLQATHPDLSTLLTAHEPAPGFTGDMSLPEDSAHAVSAFVARWKPELCLWVGGGIVPSVIRKLADRGVPAVLVDPDPGVLTQKRGFLYGWGLPSFLARLARIMVRDEATAGQFRRVGGHGVRLAVTGPFEEVGTLLPWNENDRQDLRQSLGSRPVWLAAGVTPAEIAAVLGAHRDVMRFALRTALVLVPSGPERVDEMAAQLRQAGLRFMRWSEGALPPETTQVILVDELPEMGLWYRLAPVAFLGGSLDSGAPGQDPVTPAAHGIALISGPGYHAHAARCRQFEAAGALRIVGGGDDLAAAVKHFLAPDAAATMARVAWDMGSRGAPAMDAVADLVQELVYGEGRC